MSAPLTRLPVRVQPGARNDALVAWMSDGTLKLKVIAAPEAGRANQAVIALLARVLEVAPSRLALARGAGSRSKTIEIAGLSEHEVRARVDAELSRGPA